jgi:hypothetical protein
MSNTNPIAVSRIGDVLVPRRPSDIATLESNQICWIEIHHERSAAAHRYYFAAINQAWENMTENMTEKFPTPDHLRRFALIKTGWAEERNFACSSKAEALRLAAFLRPLDDFAIVVPQDRLVTVWTAKSQSYRGMTRAQFQTSVNDVLAYLEKLLGVAPGQLAEAGRTYG